MRQKSYAPDGHESTVPLGPFAFLGFGRAGRALAREWAECQLPVSLIWDRAERRLPPVLVAAGTRCLWSDDLPSQADLADLRVVVVAVRDESIAAVTEGLDLAPGAVVFHLSGACASSLLRPPSGCARGSYHPLQSFPAEGELPDKVPPYTVALEGDSEAIEVGLAIAAHTGHPARVLAPADKAAYHAAAVLASNLLVALESAACDAAERAGFPPKQAWQALRPLVYGTLANLDRSSPREALTGPIARGDAETVRANLAALEGLGQVSEVYRELGRAALQMAQQAGLDDKLVARILEVLDDEA